MEFKINLWIFFPKPLCILVLQVYVSPLATQVGFEHNLCYFGYVAYDIVQPFYINVNKADAAGSGCEGRTGLNWGKASYKQHNK